ncbi:MAG TPA: MFS transporter [Polyangiaceae bacterium]|nr:MFS transporter [Polyangiaceae bacterium]
MQSKHIAFAGLCLGFFILIMDTTTVPLLYPRLMDVFHVTPAGAAWVNNVYLITYAAFLLLGGRLGDSTNRKTVVQLAYLALGAGAALAGAGQSLMAVIVGRAVMGVGAGLLTPQTMGYISILFAQGGRGAALGIWASVAGTAAATGPVVTQLFLATLDWRWVMWVNVPVALICFGVASFSLPSVPGRGIVARDTAVSGLCGLGVAVAVAGVQLIVVSRSPVSLGGALLALGAATTAALVVVELKKNGRSILPPELWRDSSFLRTSLISGLLGFGLTGVYLPLVFLLDARLHFGHAAIGALMTICPIANALVGPFAGRLSDRMEPERIIRLGLTLFAIANVSYGVVGLVSPSKVVALIALGATMAVAGSGTGLAFAPLANLALARAQRENVGQAASFFNASRQLMSALGGVLSAIVFDTIARAQLGAGGAVTVEALRSSPSAVASPAFACFALNAAGLALGAYVASRSKRTNPEVSMSLEAEVETL